MSGVLGIHEKGFAHRDLKVENIVFDPKSGILKIIDFGFSLEVKEDERVKYMCGTPTYLCPDQTKLGMYLPIAADIWACGVIFYHFLTGEFPFHA